MAATARARDDVVRAQAKWVRLSARKARVVLEHIRGRTVPEARTMLAFTSRAAAIEIEKVLRSAVANAEANHGVLDAERAGDPARRMPTKARRSSAGRRAPAAG